MGGSLGLAAKRCNIADEVCGYARRKETRDQALVMKAVDRVTDSIHDAIKDADIIVFCLPVFTIRDFIKEFAADFPPDSIVTDVGSTKTGRGVNTTSTLKQRLLANQLVWQLLQDSGRNLESRRTVKRPPFGRT